MNFPQPTAAPAHPSRGWRALAHELGLPTLLLGLVLYALPVAPAQAQNCWVEGALGLDFGTVTPAGGDASSSTLRSVCRNDTAQTLYYRACLFLNPGQSNSVAPRRMTNYNGSDMDYDLYSDPARTRIIGPAGSGHPVYGWAFSIGPGSSFSQNIIVYGRVPAGLNLPATQEYKETGIAGSLRWRYGGANVPPDPDNGDCLSGGAGGGQVNVSSSMVTARFANACRIVAATDLEFGNVTLLDNAHDQTSTIQLQCPTGTVWRVGLNDGIHALDGARRMTRLGGGSHVRYELYRDSARTQRWGNTIDTDTSNGVGSGATQALTVYGRVPVQSTPEAGTYSDTVTITLTF